MTTPELQLHYPDWKIVRLLGEGSFGQVYEIKRSVFDAEQRAALKVIRIPKSPGEVARAQSEGMDEASLSEYFHGFVKSLSDEIALLSRLKGNSNIVSYEDHMIIPNPEGEGVGWTILIRMELLTPLVKIIRDMSQREVLRLGLDLCKALTLCQREHIIHRDIKPDNIFVSPNGDYKLGDFGVARELEQTAAGLSRKGTFSYMAPEVFNGLAYNATVDIYSLGVVLYALLNGGRTPFLPLAPQTIKPSDREQAQTRQLSGESLPPLMGVNPAWDDIIAKACAKDPKARYQSAGELAEALRELAGEFEAGGTVDLWNSAGSERPGTASEADTEEPKTDRWIDGTPVKTAKPEQEPEPKPEPEPTQKKKLSAKLIAIIVATAVLLGGGITALMLVLNIPKQAQLLEYRDYAQQLCQPGLYEDCVTYINSILPKLGKFKDTQTVGEIYYLQGESYFEQEQYQAAIAVYEAAGTYLTNDMGLQRDTAIAFARSGDIARAESSLQSMRALPDSEGAVALLQGEIAFAKEQYDETVTQLNKGLGLPNSSNHARYRAYLICDKAYRKLEGKEKDNIALLRKALTELPQPYHAILNERLADAFSRDGQYAEAAKLFEQLRDGGDTRLATLQNIGLLYQQMKQYGKARTAFEAMREAFPKQHEGPMRLCYLVLAEQAEKKNEQRDYAEAQRLYAEAKRLYDARPVASEDDLEMQKLTGAMEDLERGGWLELSKNSTIAPTNLTSSTNPTTITKQKAQAGWAKKMSKDMRDHFEHLKTIDSSLSKFNFSMTDTNSDGIPELFWTADIPSYGLIQNMQGQGFSINNSHDVFVSGKDIWTLDSTDYERLRFYINQWTFANNKIEHIGQWELAYQHHEYDGVREERNYTYSPGTDILTDIEISAAEYEEAKRKAESGNKIRFEHTYKGGSINLEDYWP